jgi:hypothetical protein
VAATGTMCILVLLAAAAQARVSSVTGWAKHSPAQIALYLAERKRTEALSNMVGELTLNQGRPRRLQFADRSDGGYASGRESQSTAAMRRRTKSLQSANLHAYG